MVTANPVKQKKYVTLPQLAIAALRVVIKKVTKKQTNSAADWCIVNKM